MRAVIVAYCRVDPNGQPGGLPRRKEHDMVQVRRWWDSGRMASLLGMLALILVGCGSANDTNNGTVTGGTTRLVLQVTTVTTGQTRSTFLEAPGQTRVGEQVTRIRAEVSGLGITPSLVVECPLAGPSTATCVITTTATTVTLVINLDVPSGLNRVVTIIALDQTGTPVLRGQQTVNLLEPTQTLQVTLNPFTGSIGTTLSLLAADTSAPALDWRLLTRPAESQAMLQGTTTAQPTFLLDAPGTYVLQLTVSEAQLMTGALRLALGATLTPLDDEAEASKGLPCTWALLTHPAASTVPMAAACAQLPTLVADVAGTYVFQIVLP